MAALGTGEEKRLVTAAAHAQCGSGEQGVWCCKECVCACREGGCLTRPRSRGSHTLFVLYFLCHMTCRFFFFLNPPTPPTCERRSCQAGKAKQLWLHRAVPH